MLSDSIPCKGSPLLVYCCLLSVLFRCGLSSAPNAEEHGLVAEEEQNAFKYLADTGSRYSAACNKFQESSWLYLSNMTKETEKAKTEASNDYLLFQGQVQKEILAQFPNWSGYKNHATRRGIKYLLKQGPRTMSVKDVAEMNRLRSEMETYYATATVCNYHDRTNCNMKYDPDLQTIFKNETDPKVLAYYWIEWNNKMSELVPPEKYQQFINTQTTMAKKNGYKDMFQKWMQDYDDDSPSFNVKDFRRKILKLWEELRPMFEKLHALVRMKLKGRPEWKELIGKCGYIPVHSVGHMWGAEWSFMDRMTKPYPDIPSLSATEAMKAQNYTPLKIFQTAEKFFVDLGFPPMTKHFWEHSIIENPNDGRDIQCHPQAFDMCLGKGSESFRIKECTKINQFHLSMCHHEMGHVAYYMQYTDKAIAFRKGANPGFHEAIGDAISLSVIVPTHLQCKLGLDLGLDNSICDDEKEKVKPEKNVIPERDINFLFLAALSKLTNLPFGISVDSWRWEVFEGKLAPEDYNRRWWEIRRMYQGVEPPNDRMSPNLFDPATVFHVTADVEYLRYFISIILQYQFYEGMCIAAGEYDPENQASNKPLYRCDFSGSKEAGRKLMNMMKLGMSKEWPAALEAMTGSREMSTASIKRYFQPLMKYIEKELEKNGEVPGWGKDC